MSGISQGFLGEMQGLGIKFVCGNIAERALWLAYGVWIGYFNPAPPISETEQRFVPDYSSRLSSVGMPTEMEQLCVKLAHVDLTVSASFYAEDFPFIPLARPMPEWFPVFQAVLSRRKCSTNRRSFRSSYLCSRGTWKLSNSEPLVPTVFSPACWRTTMRGCSVKTSQSRSPSLRALFGLPNPSPPWTGYFRTSTRETS